MQVSFTCRQFDASEELKELIQSKLAKRLDRVISPENSEVRVTLANEKAWTTIEVLVTDRGEVFKGLEKTQDLYPTIDVVIEKVERQLARRKDIVRDRRGRAARA